MFVTSSTCGLSRCCFELPLLLHRASGGDAGDPPSCRIELTRTLQIL